MPRSLNRHRAIRCALCACAFALAAQASAQSGADIPDVGIDQRLDAQLPLDLTFHDEQGQPVTLGEVLEGSQPAVLALVYYDCTMLCGEVLNGMLEAFREQKLSIGEDFKVITISFDPDETFEKAAPKKNVFVNAYGREGAADGWRFLTNTGDSAKELAALVGFRYAYLPDIDEYAHGSAIMVITPSGKVSRYLYGIQYPERDLRLALVDAGEGKIGTLADQVMLMCMNYDPESGAYTFAIMKVLQLAGTATAGVLAISVAVLLLRERRHRVLPVACES